MVETMALSLLATAQVPLSVEENDLLNRSSKKIKNGEGGHYDDEWPKLGKEGNNQKASGLIFAEKLKGISHDEKMEEDPVNEIGRNIGYKLLLSILQKLWAKKGVLSLINIGNGFFVVKLSNKEDYLHALTGGPWMLFDHYLTVRPWEPQFQPKTTSINKVSAADVHVGESANAASKDPAMGDSAMKVGVEERADAESWKFVQRPRRQKKHGKEKQQGGFQRPEEGSRFGVLVEDGISGVE
ncbi:hypothetical protein K1719_007340 [Acacia pycnantha]|nr:hypothetical protein K1719_007340 [Acacia pycnantha]